jgi:hypothetical protein
MSFNFIIINGIVVSTLKQALSFPTLLAFYSQVEEILFDDYQI